MPDPTPRCWWRSAVIYQVYIRSFADGNGDGVGDIGGIRSRLDHLVDLGVDALWITPWYPSPMADGGYDVADYTGIAAEFGTLADAEALVADAHAAGLRVIIDIVPNHTSDRHPWFAAALAAGPGSPERDRYWFRDGRGPGGALPPNDWRSVWGGPAWQRVRAADGTPEQWYLHLFAAEQPDLNWGNPAVRADFERVLRFWFDRGVDGFRIDVAHGLVKDPALPDLASPPLVAAAPAAGAAGGAAGRHDDRPESAPEVLAVTAHPYWDREQVHEIYRGWRRVADSYPDALGAPGQAGRMFVAEAWVRTDPGRLARYLRPDELHSAFNFDFLKAPWDAARLRATIDQDLAVMAAVGAPVTWVLSNHDVPRHLTRFGREPGHEHDFAGAAGCDIARGERRARAAALLMLALPGGAYVYQGEELALAEIEDLPDDVLQDPVWERSGHAFRGRDGCRVPLPWSGSAPPFGFGPAGSTPWLPQPAAWAPLTVAAQRADPASTLSLYRTALAIRRDHPALGEGGLGWLELGPDVLAFTREPGFACVVNFGPVPIDLPAHRRVLVASGPLAGGRLPTDTACWLAA